MATTESDEWRLQSADNKQGSDGFLPKGNGYLDASNNTCGLMHTNMERAFQDDARRLYETRLKSGIAREQARKDLPLSTYTEAYWKCDLHNIFHFLGLRMAPDAQAEIRQYATVIGEEIVAKLFPLAWEAFVDYRLGAVTFSRLESVVLKWLAWDDYFHMNREMMSQTIQKYCPLSVKGWRDDRCRERDEFLDKLERMGLIES